MSPEELEKAIGRALEARDERRRQERDAKIGVVAMFLFVVAGIGGVVYLILRFG